MMKHRFRAYGTAVIASAALLSGLGVSGTAIAAPAVAHSSGAASLDSARGGTIGDRQDTAA